MMELIEEQRVCVKFCFKLGKTATETYELLKIAYGDDALRRTTCFEWFKRFKEGRTSLKDDERPGRPSTSTTDEKVVKVRELIHANRRLTVREVARQLEISYGSCQEILSNILSMSRVSAKFVPRLLTEEQKENRLAISKELLERSNREPNFINTIITGDESWIYGCDVKIKNQTTGSPNRKRVRIEDSKAMIITFFDSQGIVHHEWVPMGQTINETYYLEVIKRLSESVRMKRQEVWTNHSWTLHHDNTLFHSSLQIRQYLAQNKVSFIPHPLYSPDLAPFDFFLFPKLKSTLKGHSQTIEQIIENADANLRAIPKTSYKDCFQKLKKRWQRCISAGGDYFEDDMK